MKCRHCGTELTHEFLNLGFAPPSNDYVKGEDLHAPEKFFPLVLNVCHKCWLVQTEDHSGSADLFRDDYAYFSSVSTSWLAHARAYADMIIKRLSLTKDSFVVELASNDGYLLRNFVEAQIPCLGIEPTKGTAEAAKKVGVISLVEFFGETLGRRLASEGKSADLIAGNNVFAHVPDINDFSRGMKQLLKPQGTVTLEFPHLLQLIQHLQFDTVYHEHFSYLSLYAVSRIFESCGLRVYDVEEIPTHGGSLRVYGCHKDAAYPQGEAVANILEKEKSIGMRDLPLYQEFQGKCERVKDDLLLFLIEQKRAGKKVAGYGAAAKGVTLLNFAGVRPDLLPFVCDAAPSKQGKFLPGCHIPIVEPKQLFEYKPGYVVIFPWNIATEVMKQNKAIKEWGGKFVIAIPSIKILDAP